MKPGRIQSLSLSALIAGLVLVALGGWGALYFSAKSASEKENQWALKEQQLNDEIASLKAASDAFPAKAPPQWKSSSWESQTSMAAPVPIPSPSIANSSLPASHAGTRPLTFTGSAGSDIILPSPLDVPAPARTPRAALITSDTGSAPFVAAPATASLTDKQRQALVQMLNKHPGKTITICCPESNAAALALAGKMKQVFEQANWQVDGIKQIPFAKPPAGLGLACGSYPWPDTLVAAYHAFAATGIPVTEQLDSKLTGPQVELIVGAAPSK